MTVPETIALTPFSHGGGCGCKIAPGLLVQILARALQRKVRECTCGPSKVSRRYVGNLG